MQNPWTGVFLNKVAGYRPAKLLKVNSLTDIFQGFCLDYSLPNFWNLGTVIFQAHLSLTASENT